MSSFVDVAPSESQDVSAAPRADALSIESGFSRWAFSILALLLIWGFGWMAWTFWVPAHGGIDQNGYLVGGKMLAQHGSMSIIPRNPDTGAFDPFGFVGGMWVGADDGTDAERYYPKYPLGLPALYALALKVGGAHGPSLVHMISPVCMTLSLLAVFLMIRRFVGSFAAWIGTLIVACSPVTLMLTDNPNSHAAAMFFVAWGMFLLLRWWQVEGIWRAIIGGLFLGMAVTVRYTEATLLLCILLVIVFRMTSQRRWADVKTWASALAWLVFWIVPVGVLLIHNRIAMGALTGYDPTNESTGFTWEYFDANWQNMLRQLYSNGLVFVFPLAVGGLLGLFAWNWRLAAIMAAWILPCLGIYTAYYWAPNWNNIGYLRFFLTIFPAMAFCAVAAIHGVAAGSDVPLRPRRRAAAALATGGIAALAGGLSLYVWLPQLDTDWRMRYNLNTISNQIMAKAPAGSVLFCEDQELLHHLQFAGDYRLYTGMLFDRSAIDRLARRDLDDPQGLDPRRAKAMYDRLKDKTQADLHEARTELVAAALDHGRRVFIIVPNRGVFLSGRFVSGDAFTTQQVLNEREPLGAQRWAGFAGPAMGGPPAGMRGRGRAQPQPPPEPPRNAWQMYEVLRKSPTTPAT